MIAFVEQKSGHQTLHARYGWTSAVCYVSMAVTMHGCTQMWTDRTSSQAGTEAEERSEEGKLRTALAQEQRRCRELLAQLTAQAAESRRAHEAVMVRLGLSYQNRHHGCGHATGDTQLQIVLPLTM